MNPILKHFNTDETLRDTVKEYLIDYLNTLAIKRVMKQEDTKGVADAHEVIIGAFIKLKEDYGVEPKPIISSSR